MTTTRGLFRTNTPPSMPHLHNSVQLIGRAGAAVDLLRLTDGTYRGTLRLYQDTPERGSTSASHPTDRKQHATDQNIRTPQVHTLVAWNATAQRFHERVRRGDTVLVQGRLHNRKFLLDGQTHVRTEVHVDQFTLLSRRPAASAAAGRSLGIRAQSGLRPTTQPALAAEAPPQYNRHR